jgi:hypothetical protein
MTSSVLQKCLITLFFLTSSLCFLLFSFSYSYLAHFLFFSLPGIILYNYFLFIMTYFPSFLSVFQYPFRFLYFLRFFCILSISFTSFPYLLYSLYLFLFTFLPLLTSFFIYSYFFHAALFILFISLLCQTHHISLNLNSTTIIRHISVNCVTFSFWPYSLRSNGDKHFPYLSRIEYRPLVYTQSFHWVSRQSTTSFRSQASQAPLIASRFSDVTVTCRSWTHSLHGLCGVMAGKLSCYVGQ